MKFHHDIWRICLPELRWGPVDVVQPRNVASRRGSPWAEPGATFPTRDVRQRRPALMTPISSLVAPLAFHSATQMSTSNELVTHKGGCHCGTVR